MVFFRLTVLIIFFIVWHSTSRAEYRAFRLKVSGPKGEKFIPSNLDPGQYREYYPVQANETVTYTDTWMCRGRTGDFQTVCPNPKEKVQSPTSSSTGPAPVRAPAAQKPMLK